MFKVGTYFSFFLANKFWFIPYLLILYHKYSPKLMFNPTKPHCNPYPPQMSAKRAGRFFRGGQKKAEELGVLIPQFFGAVFQSQPMPGDPIRSPLEKALLSGHLVGSVSTSMRHRGICSDQIMFHKRSHLWRMGQQEEQSGF